MFEGTVSLFRSAWRNSEKLHGCSQPGFFWNTQYKFDMHSYLRNYYMKNQGKWHFNKENLVIMKKTED